MPMVAHIFLFLHMTAVVFPLSLFLPNKIRKNRIFFTNAPLHKTDDNMRPLAKSSTYSSVPHLRLHNLHDPPTPCSMPH